MVAVDLEIVFGLGFNKCGRRSFLCDRLGRTAWPSSCYSVWRERSLECNQRILPLNGDALVDTSPYIAHLCPIVHTAI